MHLKWGMVEGWSCILLDYIIDICIFLQMTKDYISFVYLQWRVIPKTWSNDSWLWKSTEKDVWTVCPSSTSMSADISLCSLDNIVVNLLHCTNYLVSFVPESLNSTTIPAWNIHEKITEWWTGNSAMILYFDNTMISCQLHIVSCSDMNFFNCISRQMH